MTVKLIKSTPPAEGDASRLPSGATARPIAGTEPAVFLLVLDLVAFTTAFLFAYAFAPAWKEVLLLHGSLRDWLAVLGPEIGGEFRPIREVFWVLLTMAPAAVLCLQATGGYRPIITQSRTRLALSSVLAPVVGLATVTLILFTLRTPGWSRLFILSFGVLSAVELLAYRWTLRAYRQRRIGSGFYARNVVLVGSSRSLQWLSRHVVTTTSMAEYDVVGYLTTSSLEANTAQPIDTGVKIVPCLGDVGSLARLLVHRHVHEIIAVQGGTSEWLRELIEACDYFRTTVRIVPEALVFGELKDLQLIYQSDPLRLPEIVLRPRHLDSTALFIKRIIDIVVSAALLVLLMPLFAIIAAAIKLTTPRLSILYRWRVVGYNGKRFTGYKFTTMVEDAETRQADLLSQNQMQGPVFKIREDPRVTTLGRWLRKYSLNELPQLWSVLTGDMSLVGPRPAFPHELERYELWHKRKLSVRPGITCLWQVRGRNRISHFDDWVRMDLEYIENWSLWLDCKILARTFWVVISGGGW